MIERIITHEQKAIATAYEKAVLRSLKPTPNYTGIAASRRFYWGHLGELSVTDLLQERGIRYKWEPVADGNSHYDDIVVYMDGIPLSVDVKTASDKSHKYCATPKAQWTKPYLYLGARVNNNIMEIWGVCFPDEMRYMEFGNFKGNCKLLTELKDIELFLTHLDKIRKE